MRPRRRVLKKLTTLQPFADFRFISGHVGPSCPYHDRSRRHLGENVVLSALSRQRNLTAEVVDKHKIRHHKVMYDKINDKMIPHEIPEIDDNDTDT